MQKQLVVASKVRFIFNEKIVNNLTGKFYRNNFIQELSTSITTLVVRG